MNKYVMKMVTSAIGPDAIAKIFSELITEAINYKNSIPMQPGEKEVTAIQYQGPDGQVYFSLAFLDEENRIVRFEKTQLVQSFINELIKNI